MYTVQCTVYIVRCVLYTIQCIQCVQCILYIYIYIYIYNMHSPLTHALTIQVRVRFLSEWCARAMCADINQRYYVISGIHYHTTSTPRTSLSRCVIDHYRPHPQHRYVRRCWVVWPPEVRVNHVII